MAAIPGTAPQRAALRRNAGFQPALLCRNARCQQKAADTIPARARPPGWRRYTQRRRDKPAAAYSGRGFPFFAIRFHTYYIYFRIISLFDHLDWTPRAARAKKTVTPQEKVA
jgi:hypothetical protein